MLKGNLETNIGYLNKTRHSAVMLSNQLDIRNTFQTLVQKFWTLYEKRAFMWSYIGEGMEEGEI